MFKKRLLSLLGVGCIIASLGTTAFASEIESGARVENLEEILLEYSPELYDEFQSIMLEHDEFHEQANEANSIRQDDRENLLSSVKESVQSEEITRAEAKEELTQIKETSKKLFEDLNVVNENKKDEGSVIKEGIKSANKLLLAELASKEPNEEAIIELLSELVGLYEAHLELDYKSFEAATNLK